MTRLCICALALALTLLWAQAAPTQDKGPVVSLPMPSLAPQASPATNTLPINLPTALQLADARAIDIALASERIRVAFAQMRRAQVLWLPTINVGFDYYRHDGQLQDVVGDVFGTTKSSVMLGGGPTAVFAVTDALFGPLAARQNLRAKNAGLQTGMNDTLLAVAEAYFTLQQARGELSAAQDVATRTEELVRRTEKLAQAVVPQTEAIRARTEAARRRQVLHSARERWQAGSAELARLVRLDASALLEPLEPPDLQVALIETGMPVDDLIATALVNRPELAAHQALVQATLTRLRQERLRPLIPSVLLRGAATNPSGNMSSGLFAGGRADISRFGVRSDFDVQLLWEFQNLGFGNRARVEERRGENQLAVLELFRTQDQIAAEVVKAHAAVQASEARLADAAAGLKDATESVVKNFEGLQQTRRAGEVNLLVVRPQEVIASLQALAQSYGDHYGAIADFNRAQFRLYRAVGQPAQQINAFLPNP